MFSSGVFLSESLTVDVPLAVAQHRLLRFLRIGDLDSAALAAYGDGATVLTRAGVGGLVKTVAVQSIPAYQRGAVTVVPIRWLATGSMGAAFPVLDANLEMTAAESQTTVTVVGSYQPPLGKVGEAVDRILLKSVARATIHSFLGHLAEVATRVVPAASAEEPDIGFPVPEQP